MKKQIPTPVIIGVVVVVVALAGFFLFKGAGSTSEISKEPPKLPGYTDQMPAYIKEGRAPNAEEASKMGAPPKGATPQGAAPSGQ